MSYYDDYLTRVNVFGNSEQDRLLYIGRDGFSKFLQYSPSKYTIRINDNTENPHDVVIEENSKSESIYDEKLLMCDFDSEISTGSYFSWENDNWILTAREQKTINSYKKFFMSKCNSLLNGVDSNGNIFSFPCVRVMSSKTNIDTKEDKYMQITSGDAVVRVQANSTTLNLKRGVRFIFSEYECYMVGNIYTDLEEGIVLLKMEQNEINHDIDKLVSYQGKDIWIANYENRESYTISFETSDSELSVGDVIELKYTLLDSNGQESDLPVTFTTSDENIVSLSGNVATAVSNGSSTIRVSMENNDDVFDEITISVVAVPVSNVTYILDPNLDLFLRGDVENIIAKKLDNGQEVVETFTFNVDASTTLSSDEYKFSVVDSSTFSLENLGASGKVVINIIPDNDVGNSFAKEYTFKNSYW